MTLGPPREDRGEVTPAKPTHPLLRAGRSLGARLAAVHPVWSLNALIVLGTAALLAGPVGDYDAIVEGIVPWWLVAVVVAITERWPVHLEFRRSAHSFSLTDVPVTIALLFTTGPAAVAAIAAGSVVALWFRRLPALK